MPSSLRLQESTEENENNTYYNKSVIPALQFHFTHLKEILCCISCIGKYAVYSSKVKLWIRYAFSPLILLKEGTTHAMNLTVPLSNVWHQYMLFVHRGRSPIIGDDPRSTGSSIWAIADDLRYINNQALNM